METSRGAVVICNFSQARLGLNLSDPGCVTMGEDGHIGTRVGVGIPWRSLGMLLWVCVWGLSCCCVASSRCLEFWSV